MGRETGEDVTLSMSIPKMVALHPAVKAGEQALEQPPKDLKKTAHLHSWADAEWGAKQRWETKECCRADD